MRISIITVVKDRKDSIADALQSVARQKVSGFELEHLVIDGASADGTTARIRAFADKLGEKGGVDGGGYVFRWLSEKDDGLYDALNKGIRMATGDVIGVLHSDDSFDGDETLMKIATAFTPDVEAVYGDVRFVAKTGGPTVRYCTGRRFRPWMFRFGTQIAHTSFFCRRSCFERLGPYSLDYGLYGDFELLLRYIWKYRIAIRYVPVCTTVMKTGGASTGSLKKTLRINRINLRALKAHGYRSNYLFLFSRYLFKIWGYVFTGKGV